MDTLRKYYWMCLLNNVIGRDYILVFVMMITLLLEREIAINISAIL